VKIRVYIDTSVIGGCLDEEFKDASTKLIERFKKGEMIAVISELTLYELQRAPSEVQKIKNLIDAQHIAIATVERVDILVSWNFRQIVNVHKIRLYNSINLKVGYPLLEIRSPWEVYYEE
jgi:predicted nucleic acid-binding protein